MAKPKPAPAPLPYYDKHITAMNPFNNALQYIFMLIIAVWGMCGGASQLVFTQSTPSKGATLRLHFSSLKTDKGKLYINIFNSAKGFPEDYQKAYRYTVHTLTEKGAVINFYDLPAGQYAIAVFHDEDGNGKLNTNLFGFPTEGYGFSNNVLGKFGPPSFTEAAFDISGTEKYLHVSLRY